MKRMHGLNEAPIRHAIAANGGNDLPDGFLDFAGLRTRVPLSERTLRNLLANGVIPHIRVPGGRRILFDWPSVEKS